MELKHIFDSRKANHKYNTSYPLTPSQWQGYRVDGEPDFSHDQRLSFYMHIPFCEHLCKFCEYTRMHLPSNEMQSSYIETLKNDALTFLKEYPNRTLLGFDIGGGTPTALNLNSFAKLMELYTIVVSQMEISDDYQPSIEATFQTISEEKAMLIQQVGIKRVSLGIQSSIGGVQKSNGRINANKQRVSETLDMLHSTGIEKVNLDFMYGLKNQQLNDIKADIEFIKAIQPEQITLYELRTNMLLTSYQPDKPALFDSYCLLYDSLLDMGYYANFGQNTFSKNKDDKGLSSYLRHRMIEFAPYKGFGISAQSLSRNEISYNEGKLKGDFTDILCKKSILATYTYRLPKDEMLSKYIAVSGYYGSFSITTASGLLGNDFCKFFEKELDFCINEGLVSIQGDMITITKAGFINYGAVFSLFYMKDSI